MVNKNLSKIAIIGYGAMGKNIENAAKNNGIEVTNIFDIDSPIDPNTNYDFEVAIDFSSADSVINNAKILASKNKNIVIGTTGWYDRENELIELCSKYGIGIVWASNFSIGMQIFFKIIKDAMKYMNNFDNFDVFMNEIHHTNKIDSPSGTAKSIAKIIIDNSKIKTTMLAENINRKIEPHELHVAAMRGGSVVGTHSVLFDSNEETIELMHNAKNRNGFAEGAVWAAKWIFGKNGYYNFDEIF